MDDDLFDKLDESIRQMKELILGKKDYTKFLEILELDSKPVSKELKEAVELYKKEVKDVSE